MILYSIFRHNLECKLFPFKYKKLLKKPRVFLFHFQTYKYQVISNYMLKFYILLSCFIVASIQTETSDHLIRHSNNSSSTRSSADSHSPAGHSSPRLQEQRKNGAIKKRSVSAPNSNKAVTSNFDSLKYKTQRVHDRNVHSVRTVQTKELHEHSADSEEESLHSTIEEAELDRLIKCRGFYQKLDESIHFIDDYDELFDSLENLLQKKLDKQIKNKEKRIRQQKSNKDKQYDIVYGDRRPNSSWKRQHSAKRHLRANESDEKILSD